MNGKQTEEQARALNLILDKGIAYYTLLVQIARRGVSFDEVEMHAAGTKEQRQLINAVVAARTTGVPGNVIARQRQVAKSIAGYLVLEAANNG